MAQRSPRLLSVHTSSTPAAIPDDSRMHRAAAASLNTPYPTAEIIQRTQQADSFRSAQQSGGALLTLTRPLLPPAAIVTAPRRCDSPDQSPTMDDLVSSELRPPPTTILESPQQPRRHPPHTHPQLELAAQDPMPMSDASTTSSSSSCSSGTEGIAPSTREQSSASEASSGRSLLSPATNSSGSPVLPPSQAFSFRKSGASDEADLQQQPQADDADLQQQQQTLVDEDERNHSGPSITPPNMMLQPPLQPAASSSSSIATAADVPTLRASSLNAKVGPSLAVVDLAHRLAPSQPPLPTWCGLPQPTQTTTKRLKTTPLSSPSSSRAPRMSQAIENAAAAASAAVSASGDAAIASVSMFHFDVSPLATNGLFGQHLATAAAASGAATATAGSPPRSSPRSSPPPLHSNPSSSHTSPSSAPSSSMPNYLWQLVCNSSGGGDGSAAGAPESIQLWTRPCWVIGRHTSCDLVLDHISISRLHARLLVHCITGQLYLQDLNSTHGTFVNGQRILGMKQSATGGSFQLLDPHRTNGAIASFPLSSTPSPSAAGAFPLAKGSQIVFGASGKSYTLLQHDEVPAGAELHALLPRVPVSIPLALHAAPPLRKTLSDGSGSIQHSPVQTTIILSPAAAAAAALPPPSCTVSSAGLLAPLKLLHTSTSLSNLADLQRRQANVHRKRKVVSFTADTKTKDGSLRARTEYAAASESAACATPRADPDEDGGAGAESASAMQTCDDEADSDEDAKPKRQGMTAEEICLQRKMAASAAAVAVPILKLPSFPFAPRAFSAPIAGKVAARQQLAHVLATPSTPSLGDRPPGSSEIESGAASVGAPCSSRPLGVFPLVASATAAAAAGNNSSSCSTSASPSLSSPFSASAVGASFSGGYANTPAAAATASFSPASCGANQPSMGSHSGSADPASVSATVAAFRPSLKHARDPSASDDAALRGDLDDRDDQEEEKVDAAAASLLSPEQQQTNETYERLLPQPINSPASAASFTSLSLMSYAASSAQFPAHTSKTVSVVHSSSTPSFPSHGSSSPSFVSHGSASSGSSFVSGMHGRPTLLSPHHAIEAAVHTAQLGLSPHAGSPPPMPFAVAAAQAAALGDSDMIS